MAFRGYNNQLIKSAALPVIQRSNVSDLKISKIVFTNSNPVTAGFRYRDNQKHGKLEYSNYRVYI